MTRISEPITGQRLIRDLQSLGLEKGDMVYVHTSMKSIGWIKGGADTLIEAFQAVLGDEGTLVVPTHTLSLEGRGVPPYNPEVTPTVLGVFPELVRKHPLAKRSRHGSHSSAALGEQATFLTESHDPAHALGYDSPIHCLYRSGEKTLLLGVSHKANTALHLAESLAKMPYLSIPYDASWGRTASILQWDGSVEKTEQVEFPGCSNRFNLIEGFLWLHNVVQYGGVGNANAQLMDTGKMVDQAVEILHKKPNFFLCMEDSCPCCSSRRELFL